MVELEPEEVAVRWTADRAEATRRRVHAALDRRQKVRRGILVSTTAAVAVGAVAWVALLPPADPALDAVKVVAQPEEEEQNLVHFAGGAWARAMTEDSALRVVSDGEQRGVLEVERGAVEIDVPASPGRVIEAIAWEVRVEVLAGHFEVELDGDVVWVSVETGQARVSWGEDEAELEAGDRERYPPPAAPAAASTGEPGPSDHAVERAQGARGAWRAHAQRRDFDRAYASLQAEGFSHVRNTPEDLMLAVDVARLSGHPHRAASLLQRVLRDHASDPRAPLAAFTLGRVLSEDLGDSAGAARSFRRAQVLAPSGPLHGDAMIREAEALAASGDAGAARTVAQRYLERFPDGRHSQRARALATP